MNHRPTNRMLTSHAYLTFVSLDDQGKPKQVIDVMHPWSPFQELILKEYVIVEPETKHRLPALEAAVPRLRGNVGAVCTEAHARGLGAIVFNGSAMTPASGD